MAIAAASTAFVGSASAIPIDISFNVAGLGSFIADTGDVTTATTITTGTPNVVVGAVLADNIGVLTGMSVTLLPDPMGVKVGNVFTKSSSAYLW